MTGVLPSSLRVLRLKGHFDQPLGSDMFAAIPQLEQLYLHNHSGRELVIDHTLRSLRVLRLGARHRLLFTDELDAAPQLRLERATCQPSGQRSEWRACVRRERHGASRSSRSKRVVSDEARGKVLEDKGFVRTK